MANGRLPGGLNFNAATLDQLVIEKTNKHLGLELPPRDAAAAGRQGWLEMPSGERGTGLPFGTTVSAAG